MKDQAFYGKETVSSVTFLLDFKAAYGACNNFERAILWLFTFDPAGLDEAVIKNRVIRRQEPPSQKKGA